MTITQAAAAIQSAFQAGQITREQAIAAQAAIRQPALYGTRMTARDRASIVRNRFGIN